MARAKIYLLYQAKIPDWFVKEVVDKVSRVFDLEITFETLKLDPLPEAYNELRGQFNSDILLSYYASSFRVEEDNRVAILLDEDAYVACLNFVFGEALPGWGGIVYLARLKIGVQTPAPTELIAERTAKEIVHELGHSYWLGHCPNPRCVMHFSNSIFDTDYKTMFYCKRCRGLLARRNLEHILKNY